MPFSIKKSTPYSCLYKHKEKQPKMSSIEEFSMLDTTDKSKPKHTIKKGGSYISPSSTCNMDHY